MSEANPRAREHRRSLTASRDDIVREEVADALAATPAQRMAALIACWTARTSHGSPGDSIVTKDFADSLASLNREDVAYVAIGGMAVLSHVPYRTTRDLAVLIEPTLANAEKARRAVAAWGRTQLRTQNSELRNSLPSRHHRREHLDGVPEVLQAQVLVGAVLVVVVVHGRETE